MASATRPRLPVSRPVTSLIVTSAAAATTERSALRCWAVIAPVTVAAPAAAGSGGGLLGPRPVQPGVGPARGQQLVVAATLDDAPAVQDDDLAGLADRRQPVGDDDRRATGEQAAQPLLDPALRVEVDIRRRLVEDEDPRVGDERAREGDELALARRELHAALADLRVGAVGQALDEGPRAHGA